MSDLRRALRRPAAYAIPAGEGEARWWFGMLATIKATADQTAGAYTLVEIVAPPHFAAPAARPLRRRASCSSSSRARSTIHVGDEVIEASAGDVAMGPRDVPHRFVVGPDGARMHWILSPGGFEDFIREASVPAARADGAAGGTSSRRTTSPTSSCATAWSCSAERPADLARRRVHDGARRLADPAGYPTSSVGFPHDLLLEGRVRRPADGRAGPPRRRPADLAEGDRRGRGPAARLPRARRRAAQAAPGSSSRTRGAHGGYRLARPPRDHDGRGRPRARGRRSRRWSASSTHRAGSASLCSHDGDASARLRDEAAVDARAERHRSRRSQQTTLAELVEFSRCAEPRSPTARAARRPFAASQTEDLEPLRRHMADARDPQPARQRRGQGDPQGPRPVRRQGRDPRADGPERLRQVDARERDHGPPEPRGDRGPDPLQGRGHHRGRPRRARPHGPLHGLPVPGRRSPA